ncbi:MAG: DUF1926 domain-containing protein, partial [Planctomycetes bacterium]|nr:DUF1926 domain-containing protein [Planctomycetota bacterium]
RGGHLYEIDIRQTQVNLLATLNRRPEPYHETVRRVGETLHDAADDRGATSIHDLVSFKQPDLHKRIVYDNWPRKSLVDHFLQPGLEFEKFRLGQGEIGDFTTGVYQTSLRRSETRSEIRMSRLGRVGPYAVRVTKTVSLDVSSPGGLEIDYELEDLPAGLPIHFGVEFNFAVMAACQPDRYYYDAQGGKLGTLETVHSLDDLARIGLVDEWLGLDAAIEVSRPATFWTFPLETISQSEGGFEAVHQSCAVIPHWEITPAEDGRWSVKILFSVDTSAAQARNLRETVAVS